jgi:hypothetical protein
MRPPPMPSITAQLDSAIGTILIEAIGDIRKLLSPSGQLPFDAMTVCLLDRVRITEGWPRYFGCEADVTEIRHDRDAHSGVVVTSYDLRVHLRDGGTKAVTTSDRAHFEIVKSQSALAPKRMVRDGCGQWVESKEMHPHTRDALHKVMTEIETQLKSAKDALKVKDRTIDDLRVERDDLRTALNRQTKRVLALEALRRSALTTLQDGNYEER